MPYGFNEDRSKAPVYTKAEISGIIAPAEQSVATASHDIGELLIIDNMLYRVTSTIAENDRIINGTNVTLTTLAAELINS